MASNRRIRRNACGSKKRHASKVDAYRTGRKVARLQRQQFAVIHAYRCRFCGGWHWGHSS